MFVTYAPEDGSPPQTWDFKPGRVRASRAAMLERRYTKLAGESKTWDAFKADVLRGSADARRVLLWHLVTLEHPTTRIEDVDPTEDELLVEMSRAELEDMRAEVEKTRTLDEATKTMILDKLDEELESARDDDSGKAFSPTSPTVTS